MPTVCPINATKCCVMNYSATGPGRGFHSSASMKCFQGRREQTCRNFEHSTLTSFVSFSDVMMKEDVEQNGRRREMLGSQEVSVNMNRPDSYSVPRSEARSDILPEEQHQSPAGLNVLAASTNSSAPRGYPNRTMTLSHAIRIDDYAPTETEVRERAKHYCNPPSVNASIQEGSISSHYKLLQVHVVTRHGDRSPMYGVGGIGKKLHLDCTLDAAHSLANHSSYKGYKSAMEVIWQDAKTGSQALMYGLYPKEKTCMGAQLTGVGAAQHLSNGINLKRTYIDKHQLLQPNFNASEIHIRTTPYSRTYQSAIAFLYGFLPKFDFSKLRIFTGDPPNFCTSTKIKSRGYSCACAKVNDFEDKAQREIKRKRKSSKLYQSLTAELSELSGTAVGKLTWISSILDYLNGYVCHSVPLPCYPERGRCFTWRLLGRMWKYRDVYMSKLEAANYSYKKYARLYMHPLLREIAKRMGRVVRRKDKVKFVLYSGHDMTITPLKTALGFNEGLHPPFASRIVFELYKHSASNATEAFYTRYLYNGRDVTNEVVFCVGKMNKDGLCAVENFLQFVTYDNLKYFNANSFEEACSGKWNWIFCSDVNLKAVWKHAVFTECVGRFRQLMSLMLSRAG